MNPIALFKKAFAVVKDPDRDFTERVFLILTIMSEVAVFVAFIGDLLTGESIYEIAVLLGILVFVPLVAMVCLYFDRLKLAIRIIVLSLVFIVLPALFFFGGGLQGGGVVWIIFAFMYVGLVLNDKWRNIMFAAIGIMTIACFLTAYYYPELVYPHNNDTFHMDFLISLLLVGILCFVMTWSQGKLFAEQSARAKREAERAEELIRSQNRFFSSMSHEIRTPINSILGLNELILRDQSASDDIVRDASSIQGSGKLLLALINDILDFSKIEAGSMDIVPVNYRVGDMLSEIVNMLWLRAHDKGLGFEVSVDPEVPVALYGDEVRLKQIIINLLNNAIKYTKEGRIELLVESRDIDSETVELVVSVSDTGMGIKKEDLPYLFDAFKRVDEGKNSHIEGTGLGLSIVKQLVELMDGTISVNSVYGEGSTFSFSIRQAVTDHSAVGVLNIHNQQVIKRNEYESSFLAPEARILIIDDNEMNLEVESRLLADTDMGIDTALNGKDALDKCLRIHYDVIFMDHLMPGMDGVECFGQIRNQAGGLNRNTPVIVLTANAGSENRELYTKVGFDGYLVKPVSGEAMEEMLIRHISGDKLILRNIMRENDEVINASDRYAEKLPVIVASSSMSDIPDELIRKLHIPIIPFVIRTENGIFKDGVHLDAFELIRITKSGNEAVSDTPDEDDYTEFFAGILQRTHHLIYIAITKSMSKDYVIASEAAKSFDNVTVINSECLSSATGLLVMIAYKLIQQGLPAQEIISELEAVKHRLKCSFVIDSTEYMAKRNLIGKGVDRVAKALNLHPALRFRKDKAYIGGIWMGRSRRAYKKYINMALPPDTIPDPDVVFITYADIPLETLKWIEEEIRKVAYFENVIFQQASAAISSNCGPGTFGILYFLKSNKSYNLASYVAETRSEETVPERESDSAYADDDSEMDTEQEEELSEEMQEMLAFLDELGSEDSISEECLVEESGSGECVDRENTQQSGLCEENWYEKLEGIDSEAAIKNSGSEEAFKAVLKIFYESIGEKHEALENCYTSKDWENYTIRIHALKSSARLVGAMELGADAERLETAGKEGDISYIEEKHAATMDKYLKYAEILAPVYEEADGADEEEDKPVADDFLMESIYEGLREAAENMDCDMIDSIMEEIAEYAIPEAEKERFKLVCEKANMFDYEGMIQALTK